jgi:transposase
VTPNREWTMTKKYIVALTDEEREKLKQITRTGKSPAYKVNHARILLKADINNEEGGWNDSEICKACDMGVSTVERVRRRFVEEGIEVALRRKEQLNRRKPVLDGVAEAHLIALACSDPPSGQGTWTLRLLAQKMVERSYVKSVSYETVRKTLKKTNYDLTNTKSG